MPAIHRRIHKKLFPDRQNRRPDQQKRKLSSTLSLIDASGMTLESRIHTSDGYTRTKEADGSLAEFLRNYAMEPDQSPVLLYDGSKKRNQKAHVAVFDLPLEHEDLQQCADSAIRVYAEYFWSTKQYDRIAFHFTNGFDAQYTKWADGYRIRVNGNNVSWIKSAQPDTSYDSLKDYLRIVFSYAGTASMDTEAQPIPLSDLQVGDVFLKGGNPGHVASRTSTSSTACCLPASRRLPGAWWTWVPGQAFRAS